MTPTELVQEYFELIILLGHMGVMWWGAATVLCVAIIKFTLEHKVNPSTSAYNTGLGILIGVFFLSLIAYGLFCSYFLYQVIQGALALMPLDMVHTGNAVSILSFFPLFYLFPTSTFVFIAVGWLWLISIKADT